jgi:hypothetical protein
MFECAIVIYCSNQAIQQLVDSELECMPYLSCKVHPTDVTQMATVQELVAQIVEGATCRGVLLTHSQAKYTRLALHEGVKQKYIERVSSLFDHMSFVVGNLKVYVLAALHSCCEPAWLHEQCRIARCMQLANAMTCHRSFHHDCAHLLYIGCCHL